MNKYNRILNHRIHLNLLKNKNNLKLNNLLQKNLQVKKLKRKLVKLNIKRKK